MKLHLNKLQNLKKKKKSYMLEVVFTENNQNHNIYIYAVYFITKQNNVKSNG